MDINELYELGKKAKIGDKIAILDIINAKNYLIKRYSFRNEDQYQYIILKLIEGLKRYKF